MIKGISKQVIVLRAPNADIFEQAIFVLREHSFPKEGYTDSMLMDEAKKLMNKRRDKRLTGYAVFWTACGAAIMGGIWLAFCIFG